MKYYPTYETVCKFAENPEYRIVPVCTEVYSDLYTPLELLLILKAVSNHFGKNNRYAFFPSGAFAWRMNQEDFLKDVNWLSDAKLRVSMGQVGNENLPNDAASEYFAFDGIERLFSLPAPTVLL